jgi:uncharacterized membrane protein (UPF0127 family)
VAVAVIGALTLLSRAGEAGSSVAGERRPLAGFVEVGLRITKAAGGVAEWCALLAATDASRGQGLMGQTDLRGYDAMAFRYDSPSGNAFYMYRTTLPLSLAWFDGDGSFIGTIDMAPCPSSDPAACPVHRPPRPFVSALEVPRGELSRLGIGPGSSLRYGGSACR